MAMQQRTTLLDSKGSALLFSALAVSVAEDSSMPALLRNPSRGEAIQVDLDFFLPGSGSAPDRLTGWEMRLISSRSGQVLL